MHYTSRAVYEYISKQGSPANSGARDPIVERKTCRISGQPFAIFQSDVEFYDKISPTFAGKKFAIPTPTLCPEERQRRRLSFRNERKLYRRQCDASKKSIISIYHPNAPYKVYDQKIRRSDARDPMSYGRDFDANITFTEQFRELMKVVPRASLMNEEQSLENSDYVNNSMTCKNCYLLAGGMDSDHCLYCTTAYGDSYCLDCHKTYYSSHCYECLYCYHCSQCFYCSTSSHCHSSSYLSNCNNCSYCYNCSDLTNKQYYIDNVSYTPEQYTYELTKRLGSESPIHHLAKTYPNLLMRNCEDSCGSLLENCKSSCFGYDQNACEDVRYSEFTIDCKDSRDCSFWGDGLCRRYETKEVGVGADHILFSFTCWDDVHHIYYSQMCKNSSHLFGCIGLRNKSYCIFNKQYTKEEYEKKVADIIERMMTTGERGEFFHPSLSPFGYNETVAMEYFPIGRANLLDLPNNGNAKSISLQQYGYHRSDYNADPVIPEGVQCIRRSDYMDGQRKTLGDSADLETKIFICSVSNRPYRLQKAEIEFYRKHHLPLPDRHPDVRHEERMKLRPGRDLYVRACDYCGKEIVSVYPQVEESNKQQNVTEGGISGYSKIYCESCYQQAVFS